MKRLQKVLIYICPLLNGRNGIAAMMAIMSFILVSAVAMAADWLVIGYTGFPADAQILINKSSITRKGTVVEYWRRFNYARPAQIPGMEYTYKTSDTYQRVDCSRRVHTALAARLVGPDGKVLGEANIPVSNQITEPILPNSNVEREANFVCSFDRQADLQLGKLVRKSVTHTEKVFWENGIFGMQSEVEDCYKAFYSDKSERKLEHCGAMDLASFMIEEAARKVGIPSLCDYFTDEKVSERLNYAYKSIGYSDHQSFIAVQTLTMHAIKSFESVFHPRKLKK